MIPTEHTPTYESRPGFAEECQRVFGQLMRHGEQWRPVAINELSLSRATFYRYCKGAVRVAPRVWQTLDQLAKEHQGVPTDVPMVPLIARALVDLQNEMDRDSRLATDLPERTLQNKTGRVGGFFNGLPDSAWNLFDIGSARNIQNNENWPVNLPDLLAWAQNPPAEFANEYDDVLVEFGSVTDLCVSLAATHSSGDEGAEERVFAKLLSLCQEYPAHAQEIYVAIRQFAIREPLILRSDIARKLVNLHGDVHAATTNFLRKQCYEPLSDSMRVSDKGVPTCTYTGAPLRQTATPERYSSEYRNPNAMQAAREGVCRWRNETGLWLLKRDLRVFWAYPGQAEMSLYDGLVVRGWQCELWPDMDRTDIRAISPDKTQRIVIDVKDFANPNKLAMPPAWAGLTAYGGHTPFLVVPDYPDRAQSRL